MPTLKKAKVETNESEGQLIWNWADETTDTLTLDNLATDLIHKAALHGLKQKLSDSYAGATTVTEAKLAFEAVRDALQNGTWNAGRSSSGGIWVEAIASAAAVTIEEALDKWNSLSEDEKKELKKHPQIKQCKAEIDLERAKKKAEGTELDLSEI